MLKLKGLFMATCLLMAQLVWSQTALTIQGTTPDLYLLHTVEAKETWYSIGRLYNANPKQIASFNNVTMDKLIVGQQLKIPLTEANFSQDGKKDADEVFVPIHHTVGEKEWMYRISQYYNKVPVETLEKWNNITNDQLKVGMDLVVGYLKVKTAHSKLAAGGLKKITPVTASVAKKEELVKEEPKKEEPKINSAPPVTQVVATASTTASTTQEATYTGYKGGYFKSGFNATGKSTAGNAGVFRSTSGWKDGKYYALMNNVPVGTIVKVTYTSSNRSVYAKVLGQLPDMRESQGLTLRLSDAAAAELGAELGKFYVDISY
jgi:Lipoproteins